jgi:hypothetical protein
VIDYTADKLVSDIQMLGLFPDSQVLLTNDNLLALMNFQMSAELVPLIDSAAEEFFVHYDDVPYDQTQKVFNIPERAVGSKLRDLVFVDVNSNEIAIPRLRPEDLKVGYRYGIGYNIGLYGFFVKDQTVQLYLGNPSGINSYPTLRLKFFRRPSQLIPQNQAGLITDINFGTKEVTVTALPPGWVDTNTFDFVKGIPHFTSKGDDLAVTDIAGNTLTFVDALPTDLVKGDWIALAGESPIPQVPYDAFSLLTQLTVLKGLEANRDSEGMKNALTMLPQIKQNFLQIITPRVDGSVIKVTGRSNISNWT